MAEAVTEVQIAGIGTSQDNNTHSSPQVPTPIVVPVEPSPQSQSAGQQNVSLGIQQQLFLPNGQELLALVKQVQQGLAASLPGLVDGNQALLSSLGHEGTSSEVGERKRRKHGSEGGGLRHDEPASAAADKRRRKQEPQSQPLAAANDDGWQWRKYGEKIVRDTPNPRSYYKCSDTSCPARKTVEVDRDGNMINTEYKGEHNHGQPTHARAVPRAASRQPRTKKQASQATQDVPSNASTATDVSRPWSHSPSGAVAGSQAAAKDESHTSPMKGQRRPNPASKGSRRQQQQHQQQQGQHGQAQPPSHSAPNLIPTTDLASSIPALGSAPQLVPVGGGDLQGMLKAAGLHVGGPVGAAAMGGAGSTLVGADLSNWLKNAGPRQCSGSGANGPASGGLVGLDDLSGWLKQQQQQAVPAGRKGGPGRARAQEGGRASGDGLQQPVTQRQQQLQLQQCTPKAGGRSQLGGSFEQVQDSSAALGSPPALLRTVPRHLHADDGLHDPTRDLQGLSALCSPPALLRASAPEPLQAPPPLHNAAAADNNGSCGAGNVHMGLDTLHHSLAGGGPLGSASGYLGGGWGALGSPPTLEGLGSMLKTGSGFMGGAEPASLHSLLCGATSPAAFPPSAFRSRSGLHASFSPHRCDLAAFNSPHPGLPAGTPFAPHHPPSRLGEPSRASIITDAGASALPSAQQPQQSQQQAQQQGQGQQQRGSGDEDAEGEAPPGLGGLCSTPCMHGLLPCGTPGTLLPGSSCYGGLHGLDGTSLHAHALASPPSCLPGSSSRAAAVAAGACENPWGAVLMGALCSPGGGLAPPPTIPRSHGKDACARETTAAGDASGNAQPRLLSRGGGPDGDEGAAAGDGVRGGSDGLAVRSVGGGEGAGKQADANPGGHQHSTAPHTLLRQERGSAAAAAAANSSGAAGARAAGASQGQQQEQSSSAPTADATATVLPQGSGALPQGGAPRQGGGSRSRARAGGSRERAPSGRTTAAGRAAAAAQHSQQQQWQQQRVPSSLAAVVASPTCRSPRLDMLAVCAGLAGEASDLPTNFARPTHHTHAPATSHTTNSASTQPACVPSATTSSDGTIGVASLQGAPVSRAAAAVGAEGGKPDGGGGVRPTRVGTRAQQQQRVHEQQQQQQRGKKRANTCDEGQVAVAPAPRDTRAAAAGKSKAARTNAAEGDEAGAVQAHQRAPPAIAQQGSSAFAIGDGFAMIKLSGPVQKGTLSMPEGDGYVSIRLGGGPQAGKGGGCGGKKEARSPLKAHTAAPPLNDSNAAVGDSPLDAHSKPKALSNAAAASLPVCSGSEAGRAGGAACGGIEGDAAVKAQLADVFGRVAKEEAGPAAGGRGSSTQRGSRRRKAAS